MTETVVGPAYRIETERLVIRCYELSDAPQLNAALRASWDHIGEWLPFARGDAKPSVADTAGLLRHWRGEFDLDKDYALGIFLADGRTLIGSTGLHTRRGPHAREVGYWVHVDHIGKGYATETAAALTKVAFEVDKIHLVEIRVQVGNDGSAAIPRKLGFVHEATLRQRLSNGDRGFADVQIWSMLAEEYPDSRSSQAQARAYNALGEQLA